MNASFSEIPVDVGDAACECESVAAGDGEPGAEGDAEVFRPAIFKAGGDAELFVRRNCRFVGEMGFIAVDVVEIGTDSPVSVKANFNT